MLLHQVASLGHWRQRVAWAPGGRKTSLCLLQGQEGVASGSPSPSSTMRHCSCWWGGQLSNFQPLLVVLEKCQVCPTAFSARQSDRCWQMSGQASGSSLLPWAAHLQRQLVGEEAASPSASNGWAGCCPSHQGESTGEHVQTHPSI